MREVFSVSIKLRRVDELPDEGHEHELHIVGESEPTIPDVIQYARELGFSCDVGMVRRELAPVTNAKIADWIDSVARDYANHDVDAKPVVTPDPVDVRFNQIQNDMNTLAKSVVQLTSLVSMLAKPASAVVPDEDWQCAQHGTDFRAKCEGCRAAMNRQAPAPWDARPQPVMRQLDRRTGAPEFNGTPVPPTFESTNRPGAFHSGNMDTVGPSAASQIFTPMVNAKGEVEVVQSKPPTVGDSMRRGT